MSPEDVGCCTWCGRWQRRRHAYVEEFGPGDREEWCVTGGCDATWADGVALRLAAAHDPHARECRCRGCTPAGTADAMARAADTGMTHLPA